MAQYTHYKNYEYYLYNITYNYLIDGISGGNLRRGLSATRQSKINDRNLSYLKFYDDPRQRFTAAEALVQES